MTSIATDTEALTGITAAVASGDMVIFTPKPTRMDGTHCEHCRALLRHDGQLWPATDAYSRGCFHDYGGRHFRAFPSTTR